MSESVSTLNQVKHIIAVASGKGGVGKSTTSANLALALSKQGHKVGILDADIYGPSLGILFGLKEGTKPEIENNCFVPVIAYDIAVMTMAFLTTGQTPMIWRGPMVSGALLQLLNQTAWGDLDFLIIDMPPGTGDIQLTLTQKIVLSGAIIVTTPQDLALIDARKAITMFNKVNVPVLGVVENMAVHICSHCGHVEHLFGQDGGAKLAKLHDTQLLASLPLNINIRQQADNGKPTVYSEPDSPITAIYLDLADQIVKKLTVQKNTTSNIPTIEITED